MTGKVCPNRGTQGKTLAQTERLGPQIAGPASQSRKPPLLQRSPEGEGAGQGYRCVAAVGMPSIGHSSVPTLVRVMASTISRVASGSAIHFL